MPYQNKFKILKTYPILFLCMYTRKSCRTLLTKILSCVCYHLFTGLTECINTITKNVKSIFGYIFNHHINILKCLSGQGSECMEKFIIFFS